MAGNDVLIFTCIDINEGLQGLKGGGFTNSDGPGVRPFCYGQTALDGGLSPGHTVRCQ